MDDSQNEAGWGYFVQFWKYFFAIVIIGVIFLALVAL